MSATSAPLRSWQINSRILALALFVAFAGLNFTGSFVPVYLMHLGISDVRDAAVMAGYAAVLSSSAMAIAAPFWGSLGDRLGRKSMVVRATLVGSAVVGGMGLATAPWQVLMFRFAQGGFTGVSSTGPALMSTLVPTEYLMANLGLTQSAQYLGRIAGPVLGGTAADLFGYSPAFISFGTAMLLASLLVARCIPNDISRSNVRNLAMTGDSLQQLRDVIVLTIKSPVLRIGLTAAFTSQLVFATVSVILPLLVQTMSDKASLGSSVGIVLTLRAGSAAVSTLVISRHATITQMQRLLVITCAIGALCQAGQALAPEAVSLALLGTLAGISDGILMTSYNTLVASGSPREHLGAAFGVSTSLYTIGGICGGLMGGYTGALVGLRGALMLTSAELALAALIIWRLGRSRPSPTLDSSETI